MNRQNGFTLIELMLAVAISGFVLTAVNTLHKSQQRAYVAQEQAAAIQQNLRGGLYCMHREIRMAGYDPQRTGNFGITNVSLDAHGNGTIAFTLDDNLDDEANETDENGDVDARETFSFSLYDYPTANPDGVLDLARKYGTRRQLLAEHIEALGFAYAFDSEGDGDSLLDTDLNGHVIWAIDSDGDNDLDINLDEDNDGDITLHDSAGGEGLSHADNDVLADVPLSAVRAVRIWLLARGDRVDPHGIDRTTYVVANQRIAPKDGLTRRLLTTTVRCRNMGVVSNN